MATAAEKFCGRWYRHQDNKTLLVLVGESNCGKTHVAAAIFRFALAASMSAFEAGGWDKGGRLPSSTFVLWPEETDEFKAGNYSRLPELFETDLIVIDDIGAEHDPSKNAADKLCQILSRRERKFTVITTNIKIEDWPSKFDTRITDRLMRNSEVVSLFGLESYAMIQ